MKMNWFDVDSEGRCWLNDGNSEINYNGKINVDEWKKENKELVDSVEKINDGMFEIDYESIMRMEELNK